MWASAGIAYDYLFKDHPWHFFGWLKLSAKGALNWERLPASVLRVAKNVSKIAEYCQCGYDIPDAFQSLYRGIDEFSPNLVIFFTTTSLNSHFVTYYNT